MAKKILQDIKIKKHKIRETLPESVFLNKPIVHREEIFEEKEQSTDNYIDRKETKRRLHSTPRVKSNNDGVYRLVFFIFIILLLIWGVYFISNKFLNANIEIVNKHQIFTLENKEFTASKGLDSKIPFEIMIVSSEESKNIILLQTQDVSIKAKGEVTLYNEYSTKSQNLTIHSYLADNNGKTYTLDKAVSIPGYKIDKNKVITPGSATVGITAFLPGSVYNGNPSDFTITSFKGTTKFKKIYGKTTTGVTGGAQGIVYTVGDEDKANLETFANSSFKNNLIKKAEALVPPGYILYPDAFKFSYQTDANIISEEPKASVKIYGTLSAVILKENNLSTSAIKSLLPNIKDEELKEIQTPDISKLLFSFADENQIVSKETQNVLFTLSGNLETIWNPDIDLLKTKLLGVSKKNILPIFKQDPGITTASTSIFPPWQSNIPNDLLRINIKVK